MDFLPWAKAMEKDEARTSISALMMDFFMVSPPEKSCECDREFNPESLMRKVNPDVAGAHYHRRPAEPRIGNL
jgi:hypothetical protein